VPYDRLEEVVPKLGRCDAVLLDVPCSNTGVLARRPEVRLRINPQAVGRLSRTQLRLLQKAAEMINAGSRICYSTCSILNQENKEVIKHFLLSNPDFCLESENLIFPRIADDTSFDHDGGYVAILVKTPA
jgi:16S rRNA (cytosine967-C5)-methyltransferase